MTATDRVAPVQRAVRRPNLHTWAAIVPVLLLVGLFTVFPFLYAAWTSLHRVLLTLPARPFTGLDNYAQVLGTDTVRVAARNTLVFAAVSVPLVTALGLAVALLLSQRVRGFGILLALILLPWSIPLVSAGIIWRLLLHGNFGAVNGVLLELGLIDSYRSFLSSESLALVSVVAAHVWREFPLPAILFLAGLQAIPPDLRDAAKVDGAKAWMRFRYVVLPLLKGPLLIVLVYETMVAIALFDLIYVLTGGGPGTSTTVFSWYTYASTFKFLNHGHGAALSFIMAAFLLVAIVVYLKITRLEEEDA